MEHRWGCRVVVDIPVRWAAYPGWRRSGRLIDLSLSGGFIVADWHLRALTQLVIEFPQLGVDVGESAYVSAYVVRTRAEGLGVEWCEFAPRKVSEYLRGVATGSEMQRLLKTVGSTRNRRKVA